MGLLWLAGTAGYGMGTTVIGNYGTSLGFTLFVAAIILSSTFLGFMTKEWNGTSAKTKRLLTMAILLILVSVPIFGCAGLF